MSNLFLTVLNMSIPASYVILVVILVRLLLKKAPKAFSCALWAVVLFRLLCPISLSSVLSLLPVEPRSIPLTMGTMSVPQVNSGIAAIDHTINDALPAATPYSSINPIQVVLAAGAALWILGAAILLGYALISALRLRKQLEGARLLQDNIYLASNLNTPFVLGVFRPRIYLPEGLGDKETAYILSHERMHIRRKDPIVKSIAFLALSLHWFNPLVWITFVLLGKDMEMACDEAVLRELGPGIKKEYSSSLLSLASNHLIFNGTPLAFGEGEVKGRVKNILHYKKPAFWVIVATAAAVAALCLGLALNPKREDTPQRSDISAYPEWLEKVWEWRTPYVGSASAVGNITDSWYTYADASKNGFELYTDEPPYGVRIHYTVNADTALTPDEVFVNYSSVIEQNVVILFSLVENLDYVEIALDQESVHTFQREVYEEQYGDLWTQSESLEGLGALYDRIGASFLAPSENAASSGINARVLQVDTESNSLLVEGVDDNSILGDQCRVFCKLAELSELVDGNLVTLTIDDFYQGDMITMDVDSVQETYPTQTSPSRIQRKTRALTAQPGGPVQPLTENPDYQYLLTLFPKYYEGKFPDDPVEADLDGDGTPEQITAVNLGINGGDGGCGISVARLIKGEYTKIPLPETYTADTGFPVQMSWDGQELRIIFTDSSYQTVPAEVLASIYAENNWPDTMAAITGRPIAIDADPVSGFTILEKDNKTTALVLKQYITGPQGSHADRIGYAITELILHEDDTWDMTQYYLPAN